MEHKNYETKGDDLDPLFISEVTANDIGFFS